MTYVTGEARRDLLNAVASAIDEIAVALATLGDAYEQLDERSADKLEERLFRPVQAAYGRAKRTHADFARRSGLPGRAFQPAAAGAPSHGVKGFIDLAAEAVGRADAELAELQDSMLPVEVGDQELRAGLAEVRVLLGDVTSRAHEFVRMFGR
jgi:hypothetical protein